MQPELSKTQIVEERRVQASKTMTGKTRARLKDLEGSPSAYLTLLILLFLFFFRVFKELLGMLPHHPRPNLQVVDLAHFAGLLDDPVDGGGAPGFGVLCVVGVVPVPSLTAFPASAAPSLPLVGAVAVAATGAAPSPRPRPALRR